MSSELQTKVARLRAWCEEQGYRGVLLRRRAGFAWLTCGGDATVDRGVETAVVDLLVTRDALFVVASEIERYRIPEEELGRAPGFELVSFPWGDRSQEEALAALRAGHRMAADSAVPGFEDRGSELARLRFALTPEEVERVRGAAREAARSMEALCREIVPGVTEREVAARLVSDAVRVGGDAPVALVAFDERMQAYRHPAPTDRRLRRRALLARCSQHQGLIVSISRIVSFGEPGEELVRRHAACARVNAAFIAATLPGALASEVFDRGVQAYAQVGYPDEWKRHHQGGALGYCCRDWIADRSCREVVQEHQLFSWNPTIAGTKIEDTVLVLGDGQELLTEMPSWPSQEVHLDGRAVRCPDILVR